MTMQTKNKLPVEKLISKLNKEFEFINDEVEGILLYGSCALNTADERSDIDICIIKPRTHGILNRIFQKVGDKYDVKIFEELPLYVKIDIIENYKVVYGDEPSISYYFYNFRKNWEDMEYRIVNNRFRTVSEMNITRRRWFERRRQVPVKG